MSTVGVSLLAYCIPSISCLPPGPESPVAGSNTPMRTTFPPLLPESPVDVSPLPPQAARLRAMTIARASARTLFMLLFLLSMVKDRCSLMYERHFTGFFQALQDE